MDGKIVPREKEGEPWDIEVKSTTNKQMSILEFLKMFEGFTPSLEDFVLKNGIAMPYQITACPQ
jgi:hypothetical protein